MPARAGDRRRDLAVIGLLHHRIVRLMYFDEVEGCSYLRWISPELKWVPR